MEYYPQNTVAQYRTKLTNLIELEGDWEVGLREISVPSNVENVISGRCYCDIQTQLPGTLVNVKYSYASKRIQLKIETQYVVGIEFSEDLARLLGFDSDVRYTGKTVVAPHGINLNRNINSRYVYCDAL